MIDLVIITILGATHFLVGNIVEKLMVQTLYTVGHEEANDFIKRPTDRCHKSSAFACLGMPSGHAETITMVSVLLVLSGYLPVWLALIIVVLVCAQRVIFKRHTILQVIMGFVMGMIFSTIYWSCGLDMWLLLLVLLYVLVITMIIVSKIEEDLYKPCPVWVDPLLEAAMNKKRKHVLWKKMLYVLVLTVYPSSLYLNWKTLEGHLDNLLNSVNVSDFDCIVGIKTGGAVVANYLKSRTGLPLYYVKLSLSCDNKTIMNEFVQLKGNMKRLVCEPILDDISGKNVLLIDELIQNGWTMKATIDYLYNVKNVRSVRAFGVSAHKTSRDVAKNQGISILTDESYMIWPWGYGN